MFPIALQIIDRLVVVVGGGVIGRRKTQALRGAGAVVKVIDLGPRPIEFIDSAVEWIEEPYHPRHLDGAVLVFATATPAVNAAVVADARERGLWVNSATDPDAGNFFLPAAFAVGGLTVSVSTGGASPALARRIRDRLADQFDPAYAEWIRILAEVRREAQSRVTDAATRRQLLDQLADWPWLDQLRQEGPDAVRQAMMQRVHQAVRPDPV